MPPPYSHLLFSFIVKNIHHFSNIKVKTTQKKIVFKLFILKKGHPQRIRTILFWITNTWIRIKIKKNAKERERWEKNERKCVEKEERVGCVERK